MATSTLTCSPLQSKAGYVTIAQVQDLTTMRNTWSNPTLELLADMYLGGLRADRLHAIDQRLLGRPASHKAIEQVAVPVMDKVRERRFAIHN